MISVIVTTYNRPKALELVLSSLCNQTYRNYEIIVADDGSNKETEKLVQSFVKKEKTIPIKYIWQPDEGFRPAKIRNLAVTEANGNYLIFLDGDCIPPSNFVANHKLLAEKGWTVIGQRILTTESFSKEIISRQILSCEKKFWRLTSFLKFRLTHRINRVLPSLRLYLGYLRNIKKNNCKKVRSCNWGMWREDFYRVEGFDEIFVGWGGEDTDLAIRLRNAGVYHKDAKCCSFVLHLWHPMEKRIGGLDREKLLKEREIKRTIKPFRGIFYNK